MVEIATLILLGILLVHACFKSSSNWSENATRLAVSRPDTQDSDHFVQPEINSTITIKKCRY
jgi:hypothetical protein